MASLRESFCMERDIGQLLFQVPSHLGKVLEPTGLDYVAQLS